jgi:hypothetical protein
MFSREKKLFQSYWFYFFMFVSANSVLCYFDFSNTLQLGLIGLLVLGPLLMAFLLIPPASSRQPPVLYEEFLPSIPRKTWVFLGVLLVFIRFYKLGSEHPQPFGDLSLYASFAIDLTHHWNWKLFYFPGQHPPLYIWMTSLCYQWIHSCFLSMRLVSALLAILLVPLNYFVLRNRYSSSFSFMGTCLMALSLWCFDRGRVCEGAITILPWELICIYWIGYSSKESVLNHKILKTALLGAWTGLCYWTFPTWPLVVIWVSLAVYLESRSNRNMAPLWGYLTGFSITFFPFLFLIFRGDYDLLNRIASSFVPGGSWSERFLTCFSYFSSLFWGRMNGALSYYWYNFERLNPVWGAGFFLGLIQMWKYRHHPSSRWMALAFLIFSLPIYFSSYVEMLRILDLLPFILWVTAWGLGALLTEAPPRRRGLILFILLTFSTSTDIARIARSYSHENRIQSYPFCKYLSEKLGPGLILSDFSPAGDADFFVETYDFNAAENQALDPHEARWILIPINSHYYPYLRERFPKARLYLPANEHSSESMMQVLLSRQEIDESTLGRWVSIQRYFHQLDLQAANINLPRTYQTTLQTLAEGETQASGDRFLESCYWEKASEFYYQHDYRNHYDEITQSLRLAIEKGYPAAHLYYKLGCLYLRKNRFKEAQQAFDAALVQDPQFEEALDAKRLLVGMKKQ